jgi:cysteine sulfinate desulfinase/cysteine desulfurase-like protein
VNGKPLVYLDSAASAQKPEAVIEAMSGAMRGSYANVHRGLHTLANETTAAYEGARASIARFVNAANPECVVLTKGATHAINIVAAGVGASIEPGDEIILSVMEHHSNIVPWHFLRERKGAVLRWLDVDDDGGIDLEAFAALIGPRTRMVALTHMSNVLGASTPAAEIVAIAHAAGVPVLLDGCQAVVHGRVGLRRGQARRGVAAGAPSAALGIGRIRQVAVVGDGVVDHHGLRVVVGRRRHHRQALISPRGRPPGQRHRLHSPSTPSPTRRRRLVPPPSQINP